MSTLITYRNLNIIDRDCPHYFPADNFMLSCADVWGSLEQNLLKQGDAMN